jgi:DNA replication protein DnaC
VALIKKLSDGQYLERKEPVIFLGETGTGKSHLAVALAVAACRQSKRVRLRAESRSLCASVGNQGAAVL